MKILVIDDMEICISTIAGVIKDEFNCEIFTANSGCEGFEKFLAENPDLIITDTQMPGMDGVEVIRAIKKERKDAKIILKSARISSDSEKQAAEEGAIFWWYGSGYTGLIEALVKLGLR